MLAAGPPFNSFTILRQESWAQLDLHTSLTLVAKRYMSLYTCKKIALICQCKTVAFSDVFAGLNLLLGHLELHHKADTNLLRWPRSVAKACLRLLRNWGGQYTDVC